VYVFCVMSVYEYVGVLCEFECGI